MLRVPTDIGDDKDDDDDDDDDEEKEEGEDEESKNEFNVAEEDKEDGEAAIAPEEDKEHCPSSPATPDDAPREKLSHATTYPNSATDPSSVGLGVGNCVGMKIWCIKLYLVMRFSLR